jgi:tetratricopeptide (TPR) repeat protein
VRKGGPDVLYIVEILGPAYARSYSPSLAMELLEKWAELQPDAPGPHFWMAQVSKRLELRADAHAHYARALELDPAFYAAAVRLAREYFEVRAYEDALKLLEPFLAREPKDRELRLLVAHACQKPEQKARARSLVESLGEEFPADGEVMLERGRVELRDERYAEAETWLRRAFEKIPFDPQVAFNLARALGAQGKGEESRKWHERFVQIEKDQRQIEELTRRISRDARDVDSRIEMAVILRRNELPQPSLDWLGTALEIEPRSPRVHHELAATFEKLGRKDKAQQHAALAKQFSKKP